MVNAAVFLVSAYLPDCARWDCIIGGFLSNCGDTLPLPQIHDSMPTACSSHDSCLDTNGVGVFIFLVFLE